MNNTCKRKSTDDLFLRSKKSILKELGKNSADCSNFNNTINKIYATRKSLLSCIRKNIDKVHFAIDNLEIKICFEENFLLVNDKENNLLIFSCYENF